MAQIRISFTTVLVALSVAICLVVGLAFFDRSRQDADELRPPGSTGRVLTARERQLIDSAAMGGMSAEQTPGPAMSSANQQPPQLNFQQVPGAQGVLNGAPTGAPVADAGPDLPIDPRHQVHQPMATPALSAAQRAALSPEQLARQLQGRAALPAGLASQAGVPPLAMVDRIAVPTPVPTLTPTPRPTPALRPILTNSGGVDDALQAMNASTFGTRPGLNGFGANGSSPFSGPGTINTASVRQAMGISSADQAAALATGTPGGIQASSNAGGGWQATVTAQPTRVVVPAPTPNALLSYKGGSLITPTPGPAATLGANSPPSLSGGVMTNDPAVPSPTPNYANGFGQGPPAGTDPLNKYNLPPPPTLPGAAVRPEGAQADVPQSNAIASASKVTVPPGETPEATPEVDAALAAMLPGSIPADLAEKFDAGNHLTAARVDLRTLTAEEAGRRAEALAIMDKRPLDDDTKRLLTRTAADMWSVVVATAEEGKRQGVTVADAEFPELLEKRKDLDVDAWKAALKKANFTDAEIQSELRDLALGEKFIDVALKRMYPDEKLKEIYEKQPQKYESSKRLRVQEIYRSKPADPSAAAQVAKDMDKLRRQAEGGADFALLASQASEGPTKDKGGDLGWLDDRSNISEGMAKALVDLRPGQVSAVVDGGKGYHLYKLVDVQEPRPSFEGAKENVAEAVREAVRESAFETARQHCEIELAYKKKKTVTASNKPGNSSRGRQSDELSKVFPGDKASGSKGARKPADEKPALLKEAAAGQGNPVADAKAVAAGDVPPGFGGPAEELPASGQTDAQPSGGEKKGMFGRFFAGFGKPRPAQ